MNFFNNHIRHILFTLVFLLILILPTIDWVFGITNNFQSTENRVKSKFPNFRSTNPEGIIQKFDEFYKDNFGGREFLLSSYRKFKYNSLQLSPFVDKVIVGKKGWLFLGNKNKRVIDRFQGTLVYSENDLRIFAENIKRNNKWCNERGIKYYMMLAPNKHRIYPEFLPDHIQKVREKGNIELFKNYLKQEIGFILLDPTSYLQKAKNRRNVYHKTDTHWNSFGAFISYQMLMQSILPDFPAIEPLKLSDYNIDTLQTRGGDLARMIYAMDEVTDIDIKMTPKFKTEVVCVEDQINEIPTYYKLDPKQYEIRYVNNKNENNLKILVFRDSFSDKLLQFIPENFYETVFIWEHTFNIELIEKEKPDLIIHEIIQRELDQLLLY